MVDSIHVFTLSPQGFIAACRTDLDRARELMRQFKECDLADSEQALRLYDRAMAALSDVSSRASICHQAHGQALLRDAAELCEQEADSLGTELSLDRTIYDRLCALDVSQQDAATRHYVQKILRDFRRSGVDKDEVTRGRVKALREELVKIGQEFGNNINNDVRTLELAPEELEGLPEDFRRSHSPGPNGKVALTTDNTDYIPLVTYARSEKAREALWRLYRLRGHPKNLQVLSRMLERRSELAGLLGYPSWAAYATEDKMIASAHNATDFIERIATASQARGERDYQQLLARKRRDDPSASAVASWDSAFYQERVKAEQYGFDSQIARPYFEYSRVKQGVLDITARMFGLRYQRVEGISAWHSDVETYDIFEGSNRLGRFYLDMHPREGKYKHYAQFPLVSGAVGERLPEGALICNFPRPQPGAPALMEYSDVETFFHEFGHLLHHVLGGNTRWVGLSGVATEWDFVEAPSQMLEEWVWEPDVMRSFALHWQTGEPIPAELVRSAKRAEEYGKGLWVRQQMFYAAISLEFHTREAHGLDTTQLMAELQERYTPFRYVAGTYFHESFGHLDGYSAIYYTYMWSLVIAKDLFSTFQSQGLLNPEPARRYRRAVLEPGGSKPAADLVRDFLGRPYNFTAYEQWLNAAAT